MRFQPRISKYSGVRETTKKKQRRMDRGEVRDMDATSNEQLAELGYQLSTWAATIHWDARECNTQEWLDVLRERIELYQDVYLKRVAVPVTNDSYRALATHLWQQIEFGMGKRKRGWDLQFLKDRLDTLLAADGKANEAQ